MKTKNIFKFFLTSLLIIFCTTFILGSNKVSAKEEEIDLYSKYYYYEDSDIITRRLHNKQNNDLVNEYLLNKDYNKQFFYKLLNEENKLVYQTVLTNVKSFDFNSLNGEIKFSILTSVSEDAIKQVTKFLVRDYSSLFFISPNEFRVDKTADGFEIVLISAITKASELNKALHLYLENILRIKEEALVKPLDKDKAYVAFDKLCDLNFIKNKSNKNSSYLGHLIFDAEYYTEKVAYGRALKHIYDLLNLDSYVEISIQEKDSSISWVYLNVLGKYYFINIPDYLKEKNNKYIYSFFLDKKGKYTDNVISFANDKVSSESFNKKFSYKNITISYDKKENVYQNRFYKSRYPNSQAIENNNFSETVYFPEKLPFQNFEIKGKNNVKLNTTYSYYSELEGKIITTKVAPTGDDFSGEVLMRSVIDGEITDTYFEVTISYKVTDLITVIFSKVQDGAPFGKKQTVDCFKGDYVKKVNPGIADGWINVGYTAISNSGLFAPITTAFEIQEDFRKPQHMTFVNEKGDTLSYGVSDFSSESLLKNTINLSELPDQYCFVGYKIKEVKDLDGNVIKNHKDVGKFIGPNARRDEIPVTSSYTLVQITDKIEIKLKGTAFRYITRIKDELVPTDYDAAFRVHPKLKIIGLGNITFKRDSLSPKAYSLLNDLDFLDLQDKKQSINEFGIEVTAKGTHSFDERKIKVWIVVDHNIFLTWGWFKKWWWAVLLLLGLIVAIPFLIKPIIKLIKYIRRKQRAKRIAQKEKDLEQAKYEDQLDAQKEEMAKQNLEDNKTSSIIDDNGDGKIEEETSQS